MNQSLTNLVSSRLPIAGLLAYSIQLPDRVLLTQCVANALERSATEEMLASVVCNGRALLPTTQAPANYCWSFEQFRIHVSARADGTCLAVIVENHPGVQLGRLRELLQDFSACDSVAN